MKAILVTLAGILLTLSSRAQDGLIFLNNLDSSVGLDAKVLMPDGKTGVSSPPFYAELLVGPSMDKLLPAQPRTSFRTGLRAGYVNSVMVTATNVTAFRPAVVVLQAFNGLDYESSTIRGRSLPLQVTLGGFGDPPSVPPTLIGLQSFTLELIPEPSTIVLWLLGASTLWVAPQGFGVRSRRGHA